MRNILVTGAAGFIGFHLTRALLEKGDRVVGFDNLNDYYEVSLKEARLKELQKNERFSFVKGDLADQDSVMALFAAEKFDIVVNLAAQAGVRYSIDHPDTYMQSNVMGFFHILEACRKYPVGHLVYASSSSVYGNQQKTPFSTDDDVSKPISLYAATKKTNELMAYTYSHLFSIPATGLRFFTVYGPWGRPDMAYFSFARKILAGEPISVFNHGDLMRDFTYVDDIVRGILNIMDAPPEGEARVYNIGNHQPVKLLDFIHTLEDALGKKAVMEFKPMQPGDVYQTCADVTPLMQDFGFAPDTTIAQGLGEFVKWYKSYYGIEA